MQWPKDDIFLCVCVWKYTLVGDENCNSSSYFTTFSLQLRISRSVSSISFYHQMHIYDPNANPTENSWNMIKNLGKKRLLSTYIHEHWNIGSFSDIGPIRFLATEWMKCGFFYFFFLLFGMSMLTHCQWGHCQWILQIYFSAHFLSIRNMLCSKPFH